jgi:hypothetical protein
MNHRWPGLVWVTDQEPHDREHPVATAELTELTHRHYALLRAVAAGRCELSRSCEPDLYIDGRTCCDQQAAHLLAHAGLIRHDGDAADAAIGQRVPATLTTAGQAILSTLGRPLARAA